MKKYLLTFPILALLACGESTSATTESGTQATTDTTAQLPEEPIESRFQYDTEWDVFREAIYTNDLEGLKMFMAPDLMDAESLLDALNEDWVIEDLKATSYDQLTVGDFNGTTVVEFNAGVEGSDDEGNIYESGILLQFEESMNGLKLVNVLMAG